MGFFSFRNFFLDNTRVKIFFFFVAQSAKLYFQNLTLGYMTKTLNQIILALPSHTTHFLQPLDRSVFGPLNKAYNRYCSEFLSDHPCNLVNKWTFPGLFFSKAWVTAMTKALYRFLLLSCPYFSDSCPKFADTVRIFPV